MDTSKLTSLEDKTLNSEDENFYFDQLTGKPFWDLRKMLGRQLFKIRQGYNRTLSRVSKDTSIPIRVLDQIEVGCYDFYWEKIGVLLDYYKKRVKLNLVNRYSDEEFKAISERTEEQQLLAQAQLIMEKAKLRDEAEKQLLEVGR